MRSGMGLLGGFWGCVIEVYMLLVRHIHVRNRCSVSVQNPIKMERV